MQSQEACDQRVVVCKHELQVLTNPWIADVKKTVRGCQPAYLSDSATRGTAIAAP